MTHTNTHTTASHGAIHERAQDALAMLDADHHKLKEIFKEFDKLHDQASGKEIALHAQQACDELRMYVQVTGEIFYPALRRVMADDSRLSAVAAAHAEILDLIEQLEVMDVEDDGYDAKFGMLGDHLDRLITIESGLFPHVTATRLDTATLGKRLLQRKIEWLMDDMGLPDDNDEAVTVPNYQIPDNQDDRDARNGRLHSGLNRF